MTIQRAAHGRRGPAPAILVACVAVLAATPAAAAFRPAAPASGPSRVRLERADGDRAGETLRGIWTVLEPGQRLQVPLAGAGPVRIQCRPDLGSAPADDTFRFTADLGDTVRRFRRRSPWEANVRLRGRGEDQAPAAQPVFGVGEADEIEAPWTAGAATLAVTNTSADRRLFVRVLLGDGVTPGVTPGGDAGGDPDGGGRLPVDIVAGVPALGWDSNAYLTAKGDAGREAKWFLPLALDARWDAEAGRRVDLQAWYSFDASFYDEPVLDERRHRLRLGGVMRLGSQRPREGVDLVTNYRFTHKNDAYNGRGDREEFETTDPATGDTVSLAKRFDYDEHRLQAGLEKALGRRVDVGVRVTFLARDYVEDYASYPDIYSLDQDHLELEAEASWRPDPAWTVTGAWAHRTRDYAEKFSRDADGAEVRDVPTSLVDDDVTLTAAYGRGAGLRAHAELKFFASSDSYAGYWDYAGTAVEGGVGWRWPAGHRLELSVRRSAKDYDRARVDDDPAQPLREKSAVNLHLKGDWVLSPHWEANLRLHYKDADNNSTAFAYTQTMVVAGLTWTY